MTIKRGLRNNPRNHARNIIPKQAQARLTETVSAFNNQVQNSLAVDAVGVVLYQINQLIGKPCSCTKTNMLSGMNTNIAPVVPQKDRSLNDIEITMQDDDMFGSAMSDKIMNDTIMDVSGSRDVSAIRGYTQEEDQFEDTVGQGSVNCAICYRTKVQPGYTLYGQQRKLFTHFDIHRHEDFTVDSTAAPHAMERESETGYITFDLLVPRYFKAVTYGIRNDFHVLRERLKRMDDKDLTIEDLKRHAGQSIEIKVTSQRFTHVTIEFDLGVPRLNCNIGGENTTLDYDRLQTMSDIPVVLGPEVSDVNEGDIICIPERGLYMKVRDKERKITADQRRLEWVCSTRVLQPTEPLRNISKGYKLL